MNLSVTRDDGWCVFSVRETERWTPSTFFPQLDSALARIRVALSEDPKAAVLFDLSALNTIDSSMITLVVQTVRMAGTGRVSVLVSSPEVYSWLALLGIDQLAEIFNSEEEWRAKKNVSQQ